MNSKPHPEPYMKSCRTFAKLPHTCLAIEDSVAGVRSAKAAGMKVVAFPNAHTKGQDLG